MVVQRIISRIKGKKWKEALEMIPEINRLMSPFPGRVYSTYYAPFYTVVWENEAENEAELVKMWERLDAMEEWAPLLARWQKLEVGEGRFELWYLRGVRTGT